MPAARPGRAASARSCAIGTVFVAFCRRGFPTTDYTEQGFATPVNGRALAGLPGVYVRITRGPYAVPHGSSQGNTTLGCVR